MLTAFLLLETIAESKDNQLGEGKIILCDDVENLDLSENLQSGVAKKWLTQTKVSIMSLIVRHIIIELHHCHYEQLDDPHFLEEILFELTHILNTEVKAKATYHFEPHGVTSILIVGASHISIHTWPEYEYANIDLVVCTTNFAMSDIVAFLKTRFETQSVEFMEVQRSALK